MKSSAQTWPSETDHGDHVVIAADLNLQEAALRPGSASDIAALLSNAEGALAALRHEFDGWLQNEILRMAALLEEFKADSGKVNADMLYRALHDMRGNAATFGNPLAGRLADHLCKLFDNCAKVPSALVEAHVHAIQAVVREKAVDLDHPLGGVIFQELKRVSAALVTPATEQAG
jgi:hypothetical protein